MRSRLPRWALNPLISIFLREKSEDTDIEEKAAWRHRQRLERSSPSQGPLVLPEAGGGKADFFSTKAFGGNTALPTP